MKGNDTYTMQNKKKKMRLSSKCLLIYHTETIGVSPIAVVLQDSQRRGHVF